jgi:hypothetical protein
VTNLFHRALTLIGIQEFTQVKSHSVAQCVANRFHIATSFIIIKEFTQGKSHTVAQCVANRLHGETSWQSTVENIMLIKILKQKVESDFLCTVLNNSY